MQLATLFSGMLLVCLLYLFVRKKQYDLFSIAGLIIKLCAGLGFGLVYHYYYQQGDTFQYLHDAGIFANHFVNRPDQILQSLLMPESLPAIMEQVTYTDEPRALFFARIVSVFYLIAGGNYWIITLYLAFISFLGTYGFVNELRRQYPAVEKPAIMAFYFTPTLVFWSSGLLKESIAMGALFVMFAQFLKIVRTRQISVIWPWVWMLLSGWLLWELKYFYAAVAFPAMISIFFYRIINRYRNLSPYYLLLLLIIGMGFVSVLHYNLSLQRVLDVVYQNYLLGQENPGSKVLSYYHFDGSFLGFFINLPLAFINGLFRPTVFEFSNLFQFYVGVENTLVAVLLLLSLWRSGLKNALKDEMVLGCLFYIFVLEIMLAFSTPNLGTLSRYKIGYWPFFVFLILILNKKKKSDHQ